MNPRRKKISAHLPSDLLREACRLSELNQTDVLISGLKAFIAELKRQKLAGAAGQFHFTFDPNLTRERSRL